MAAPIPKTRFNDLLNEATSLLAAGGLIDEFSIRRIEREAATLRERHVDVSGGWELAGYCAAMRGDVTQVLACTRKAQATPGGDHLTLLRMATALMFINATAEARELIQEAASTYPDVEVIALDGASMLGRAGYVLEAMELHARVGGPIEEERSVREIMVEGGWSGEDIAGPVRFARRWLRARGLEPVTARAWTLRGDDAGRAIVFQMDIAADVERTAALELALFKGLAGECFAAEQAGALVMLLSPAQDRDSTLRADCA